LLNIKCHTKAKLDSCKIIGIYFYLYDFFSSFPNNLKFIAMHYQLFFKKELFSKFLTGGANYFCFVFTSWQMSGSRSLAKNRRRQVPWSRCVLLLGKTWTLSTGNGWKPWRSK
jgi:hypothetical protein